MRISTIDILMQHMADLWPVSFPDAKRIAAWEPQYRAVLGALTDDELNSAWHRLMDRRTKKAAPSPADILAAHRSAGHRSPDGKRDDRSLSARLADSDARLVARRHEIVDEWTASHPRVIETAEDEGWTGLLSDQLRIGANILAQRQVMADGGRKPFPLSNDAIEYFGIYELDGREQLTITNAMIGRWRSYGAPSGIRQPARTSTFVSAASAIPPEAA